MEKDNVYVLFEEIKNKIEMINGKLEQKAGTPTDGQAEEVIPTCVRHIHRHSFDIRSSKGKPPAKYVFFATSSTSIFVLKNEIYDDTRRSCRNYYVLQGTQSNL